MTVATGVFVTLRERFYRVAGTNARHLMAAATMTCPQRAGSGHVGYTDWEIGWSFTPCEEGSRHAVGAARVEVVVTRTLPSWRAPRAADHGLKSSWAELVAAIAKHEQGHVDIAMSGARSLHGAMVTVSPCASREMLEFQVGAVAELSLAAIRATDRDYDNATEHGALQGVRLPRHITS